MDWTALYGLLPFALSAFLALALALSYKLLKKLRARRSPLATKHIGHVPGQQLVTRMSDHETEMLTSVMLMYMALPMMFMLWAGLRVDWTNLRWSSVESLLAVGAAGMFGYGLWGYIRHLHARDNVADGLLAERVTGMQLNRLATQGCRVLHDLPGDGFNIDHIVVAPSGVFAVETKSFRKPKNLPKDEAARVEYDGNKLLFPDFATTKPIEQAARQAQWLRRLLHEALGETYPVIPAVALPGWFVVRSNACKSAEVRVFTPMGKGAEFLAWPPQRLTEQQRGMIVQVLASRYPSVPE